MSARTSTIRALLAEEWERLRRRPRELRHAATWGIAPGQIADLTQVVGLVGGGGDRSITADRRLRHLVALAATDDLAGRVVIERLLPGLCAAARRRHDRHADVFDDLLTSAWIAIRTYNPARRNTSVAASLLADAEWHAYRRHDRRRSATEQPFDGADRLVDDRPDDPADELARLLADARDAGVEAADLELVDLLLTASTEQIAARYRVTSRAIRYRRDRVTQRLREVALAA